MMPGNTHKTANNAFIRNELKPATINVHAMDRFCLYVFGFTHIEIFQ